eukprot:511509-Rhodomonas_salina.1
MNRRIPPRWWRAKNGLQLQNQTWKNWPRLFSRCQCEECRARHPPLRCVVPRSESELCCSECVPRNNTGPDPFQL